MNSIIAAVQYAAQIHSQDVRKYSGEPYIWHCLRVMNHVMVHPLDEKYVLAAVSHDIIEDHPEPTPEAAYHALSDVIGVEATIVVGELTNRMTKEQYPDMTRAARKAAEFRRLSACSDEVKIVKMYDRIDNLKSLEDGGFAKLYSNESLDLFDAIGDASPLLADEGKTYALKWIYEGSIQSVFGPGGTNGS